MPDLEEFSWSATGKTDDDILAEKIAFQARKSVEEKDARTRGRCWREITRRTRETSGTEI